MALLKLGPLIAGIRGTLGGTIFSANKSGPFARSWAKPVNPRSAAQQTQRQFASSHGTHWTALTQAQRDDWDTYAAAAPQEKTNSLGEAYYASGYNWYCEINTHLLLSGRARRDVFPSVAAPNAPTISLAIARPVISVNGHVNIQFAIDHFTGYDCIIFLAFAPTTAPLWKTSGFRGCHFTVQTGTWYTYTGLTALAYFGSLHDNQKAFFKVYKQTDQGRRSAPTTITVNCVAA